MKPKHLFILHIFLSIFIVTGCFRPAYIKPSFIKELKQSSQKVGLFSFKSFHEGGAMSYGGTTLLGGLVAAAVEVAQDDAKVKAKKNYVDALDGELLAIIEDTLLKEAPFNYVPTSLSLKELKNNSTKEFSGNDEYEIGLKVEVIYGFMGTSSPFKLRIAINWIFYDKSNIEQSDASSSFIGDEVESGKSSLVPEYKEGYLALAEKNARDFTKQLKEALAKPEKTGVQNPPENSTQEKDEN